MNTGFELTVLNQHQMEIVTEKSKYRLVKDIGYLVNAELYDEIEDFFESKITKDEKAIINNLRKIPGDKEIIKNLCGVNAISFGVTEACNFRCKYCVYSGKYPGERIHKSISLRKDNAFKAVEFFLELIANPYRNVNSNSFDIGFYGGEPLLEIDLIKEIVSYANALSRKIFPRSNITVRYRITTNGYLLDKNIIDYCAEQGILLDISLDGPEEEHNKFRLLADGSPTWETIFGNINYIKETYPGFYKKNVDVQPTIHPLHKEQNILDFFKDNSALFDFEKIRFGRVNLRTVNPHIRKEWLKKRSKISKFLSEKRIKKTIHDKFFIKNLYDQKKFTATCFPGVQKIFIDAGGNFHICEKINQNFPIGNINRGFDLAAIRNLIKEYNEEIIRLRCWECDYWFLCPVCYVHAARGDKIEIQCERSRSDILLLLVQDLKNKERQNETRLDNNSFTISDYIAGL